MGEAVRVDLIHWIEIRGLKTKGYGHSNPTHFLWILRLGAIPRVGAAALARRRLYPRWRGAKFAEVHEINDLGVVLTGKRVKCDLFHVRDPPMCSNRGN